MSPELFIHLGLEPALALLPLGMDSPQARAMVLGIALQESALAHRRQQGGGTARGYGQFEKAGITGVLTHEASKDHAIAVCQALDIGTTVNAVYVAIEYHDVLLSAFMRLLIWTLPQALPERGEHGEGYSQYLEAWRPGKPRQASWPANYTTAWDLVAPVYNAEGDHSS